jgi:hypothetical protein
MTLRLLAVSLIVVLMSARGLRSEALLITCPTADQCQVKRVFALSVNGRPGLRNIIAQQAPATPEAVRSAKEVRIDLAGPIVRDPSSGRVYRADDKGKPVADLFPGGSLPRDVSPSIIWNSARIAYRESAAAKQDNGVSLQSFAAFLTGSDLAKIAVDYLTQLTRDTDSSPRRRGLVNALVAFSASSPQYTQWRDGVAKSVRSALDRYHSTQGDPRELTKILDRANDDGSLLNRIAPGSPEYAALLAEAKKERQTLATRQAVARALYSGELWDEYLDKARQIGPAEWGQADFETSLRNALSRSAQAHRKSAADMEDRMLLDRVFDQDWEASRRTPCDPAVRNDFANIRSQWVEQNKRTVANERPAAGTPASFARQIRQLNSYTPQQLKEPEILKEAEDIVRAGGTQAGLQNPDFQLAIAHLLEKRGRYSEALAVVVRGERAISLNPAEADEWLKLDAELATNIQATLTSRLREARDADAKRDFEAAVKAAEDGLTAVPGDPSLLDRLSESASTLRDGGDKVEWAVQQFSASDRLACAESGSAARLFARLGEKTPAVVGPPPPGEPSWISGQHYLRGQLYYDPASLNLLPQVRSILTKNGPPTEFQWSGRQLSGIVTRRPLPKNVTRNNDNDAKLFEFYPRYVANSVRMEGIGKRPSPDNAEVKQLVYWNDTQMNVPALQKSGRLVARGWAGNPVFDPFVWNSIYLFQLKYDDKGRVTQAIPVPDETRGGDTFAETLNFVWDNDDRLQSVKSANYSRILRYDSRKRLVAEEVKFGKLNGNITYRYRGDDPTPFAAKSSNDYDKYERAVVFVNEP